MSLQVSRVSYTHALKAQPGEILRKFIEIEISWNIGKSEFPEKPDFETKKLPQHFFYVLTLYTPMSYLYTP